MTTTVQLALNLSPLVEPDYTPDLTISERAAASTASPSIARGTDRKASK